MWDEAGRLTQWLGEVPVEAQLLKMSEEVGEAAEAYLGMTGLNPRKGISHTREDLVGEVGDVIITAAVAIVQLTGGPGAARAAFESHLTSVINRADLSAPRDDATRDRDRDAGKLVRDRIPEIIRGDGLEPVITAAGPAEYAARLRDKLGEEVAEFLASDGHLTELADILEVVYALAAAGGTGQAELEALRAAKAASNGAFTQRLVWHGNQGDDEAGGAHLHPRRVRRRSESGARACEAPPDPAEWFYGGGELVRACRRRRWAAPARRHLLRQGAG
jgi:predicted house-cleaning noncanonical NTP pyrophosphatase (MazG superfamily)